MNTEKLEKLKKSLDNKFIPDNMKDKIRAEIKKLEADIKTDDTITATEVKEEVKEIEKKVEKALEVAEKKEEQAQAKAPAKTRTKRTTTSRTKKPKVEEKPIAKKKTFTAIAKEIRKAGESWEDAKLRARKMMKSETTEIKKKTRTETDKLLAMVRRNKEYKKLAGTSNLSKDAQRRAMPRGKRVSKTGNVYYENRANRVDVGGFKSAYLETGGGVGQKKYNIKFNVGKAKYVINYHDGVKKYKDGSDFYDMKIFKTKPMLDEFQRKLIREGYKYSYADGGGVKGDRYDGKTEKIVEELKKIKGGLDNKAPYVYQRDGFIYVSAEEGDNYADYDNYLYIDEKLEDFADKYDTYWDWENAGAIVLFPLSDEDEYATGGTIIGTPETPLGRDLGISYTGLVGETGAMSSGEMFAEGGGVDGKEVIKLKVYGLSGKVVRDGNFIINYNDNTITFPSGKTFKVEEDKEYTIKIEKTKIKAKRGVKGLSDFLKELNTPDTPFGSLAMNLIALGKDGKYEQGGSLVDGYLTDPNFGDFQAGVYEMGGNTGLPAGTEQHFVNYYLGEGTAQGIYAKGGGVGRGIVLDKFKGKSPNNRHYSLEMFTNPDGLDYFRLYDDTSNDILAQSYDLEEVKLYAEMFKGKRYAKGGGVRMVGNREYPTGRAWTNEHKHIDKADSREVNYKRKKSFDGGGGIEDNAPSVYIADLEAYNNGRLVGKWFNLLDYSDADEFNEAVADFLKETGAEEYAVHDFENIPRSMQSEYLGVKDFEEIYEMIDLARDKDLPLEVVMEVSNELGESAVDEFYGVYDSEEDFAEQLVDDLGIESFNNFEYYLEISDTDRRLLAQDMADSYVDDIRDEDGGNRLIEEAGLDVEEYEEADSERQEEMLDEAREIVYNEYYNNWYDGLSDPYNFLVEEQGLYDAESFAKADFVRVDIEKLARELEYDYTFIRYDGQVYVFSVR